MITKVIDWSYTAAFDGKVPGYGACRAVLTPSTGYGEYASLLPVKPSGPDAMSGFVESSFAGFTGPAALPIIGGKASDIIFVRIPHNPGDGRIAGGGHKDDVAYEWGVDAAGVFGWQPRGVFYGPNGLVYGYGDFLTICADRPEYSRTAGWYNGLSGLVPSVSARSDPARGIWEYTDFGDVAIGQAANGDGESGLVAVSFRRSDGSYERLRLLDPRPVPGGPFDARNVLIDRSGDLFGIAVVDLKGRKTYFCWPTRAELYAL